jgi:small conductance mechanosensitive channel
MFSAQAWQDWKPLILEHGASMFLSLLHMIVIITAGWITVRLIRRLLRKMESVLARHREDDDALTRMGTEKRIRTLTGVLNTVATIGIWAMVVVSGLNEMGINIGPILTGVGIAGLAVGFGAQNLVRDVITGFFIILENQVRVGDVAIVNGTSGLVEAVTFRTITLRDITGTLHVFPHGSIVTLANQTADWSAAVLDVGVAYSTDIEKATRVMEEVYQQLSKDETLAGKILEPIEVFGVDNFGPNELVIKARIKTVPREQWTVGREYRKRLKYAFDREGIEIPFPQRTLHIQTLAGAIPPQAAPAA